MRDEKKEERAHAKEWAGFVEYVMYLQNWRRLLWTNFIGGLVRGVGIAVGFSILGAVVILLVEQLALKNLPGIGAFFAEIVRIVQLKLY